MGRGQTGMMETAMIQAPATDKLLEAKREVRRWREHALYASRKLFNFEPDPAQVDLLNAFSDPEKQRIALKACKGPGKTAGLAVCAWIFLSSRPHPKIAATSISGDNLRDNLWAEMSKWQQRSPYLMKKFEWQKERIICRDHPETWWMSARTWAKSADAEKMGLTLAGLHADYTLALLDESGGIPDAVMATADASLSTVGGEHRVIQAGNPTHVEGPLYRACTNERHLWHVIEITGDPDDPKRSPRISLKWAKEQIEKYGKDNPWVLVNVFGKFPPASINQLLGPDEITAAMSRWHEETVYSHEAKILGIDPGRFGGARSVIFPRQGLQAFNPVALRPNRQQRDWTGAFAGRIIQAHNKWHSDAQFIDETGGWGGGILDACVVGGLPIIGINFSSNALDRRYRNRRAEMYFKAADWVKRGGALPNLPELVREATVTTYTFRGGQFVIEDKEQVQDKLNGESPDLWDAFVLTHAQEVVAKTGLPWIDNRQAHAKTEPDEYDYHRRTGRAVMEED